MSTSFIGDGADPGSPRSPPIARTIRARVREYAILARLHRPIGSVLLLWPTLWALWAAAEGPPAPGILAVFLAGIVLTRSAGCAINDYFDRDIDRKVARTRTRPLACGAINRAEAIAVAAMLALCAFLLTLTLNRLTVTLAIGGAAVATTYPLAKRWLVWPQVHLGIAFSWPIPMAFAAVTGTVPAVSWWLFAANFSWTVGYDTLYAMADRLDDAKIGVRSTAVASGGGDRMLAASCHALTLALLAIAGMSLGLGAVFYLALAPAALLAAYQQFLVRRREPQACIRAFVNNGWFGACVFAGFAGHYAIVQAA